MEFPRLMRKWTEWKRHRGGGLKRVVCEEREYAEDDPRGQYQLWMDGEYAWDITRQVLQRQKDHTPMAWLGDEGHGTVQPLLDDLQRILDEDDRPPAFVPTPASPGVFC